MPAPRAAFYRVFVDSGAGPQYWGLYTMVEDPSDGAMLDAQFGGQGGNLYKPDGPGADWTKFDAEGFEKKTNDKEADFQRRVARPSRRCTRRVPILRRGARASRQPSTSTCS